MPRQIPSLDKLYDGVRAGNRVLLGQAITLVESAHSAHQALAHQLIDRLLQSGAVPTNTLRVGITGAPGAGKSTFIETLGNMLVGRGQKLAVLAIDPSSQISRGSILGDKTRMEQLSVSERAFIRPSPSGNSLGGVARKTRETILLVEAAGFDTVFIETVGVGQSETAVHSMTDVFMLLLLPGAGDELQGIKRGIVEMADLLLVNKADGARVQLAHQAQVHYSQAIHFFPPKSNGWTPRVLSCSATERTGIEQVWDSILEFQNYTRASGAFIENRRMQAAYWLREALLDELDRRFKSHSQVRSMWNALEPQVLEGRLSPFSAAEQILGKLLI